MKSTGVLVLANARMNAGSYRSVSSSESDDTSGTDGESSTPESEEGAARLDEAPILSCCSFSLFFFSIFFIHLLDTSL